jgi:hypothetical protein
MISPQSLFFLCFISIKLINYTAALAKAHDLSVRQANQIHPSMLHGAARYIGAPSVIGFKLTHAI